MKTDNKRIHKTVIKPFKEVEILSAKEREEYYETIRNVCLRQKMPNGVFPVIVHIFSRLLPLFRNFEIDIRGKENIPIDDSVIFVCNHSNSHDGLVMNEILSELDFPITSLVAWDGLNILSRTIFRIFDGVLID